MTFESIDKFVLPEPFDPGDRDPIYVSWADKLVSSDILTSEWILPDGWGIEEEQTNVMFADTYGERYTKANSIVFRASLASGRYTIVNKITTTTGDVLTRPVIVSINHYGALSWRNA